MKILFVCNKSPYPHNEGGPIAMNRLIEGMIKEGHQVKVLAINSHKYFIDLKDVPEEYKDKTGLELEFIDLKLKPWEAFKNLFTNQSYHVERFISDSFRKRLADILAKETYDVVQMETLFVAPYMDTIRTLSPNSKVVLRAHNIEYLIWERVRLTTPNPLKKLYLKHIVKTLKSYEEKALPKFDGVAAITSHDAATIGRFNKNTIAIPFGIYPEGYAVSDPNKWEFPSLFHIGSMNWIPNEEGIRWFLDKVWPLVHQKHSQLKLYLAGRHMPQWLLKKNLKNVEVLGEVPSAEAFMENKGVMVVPLLSGSGIRIKIIEGMAAAKPIVSTSTGAEGIDVCHGKDIMLADSAEDFSLAIDQLVHDFEYAKSMAMEARATIEKNYDNAVLIKNLLQFYEKL